jgi:hypothetical protein
MATGYSQALDGKRLEFQRDHIRNVMLNYSWFGTWRTLAEIEQATDHPQASISAQLRNLRKARYGGYIVEKRRRGKGENGCWEYLLRSPVTQTQKQLFQEARA